MDNQQHSHRRAGRLTCLRTESGRTVPMGINPASAGRLAFTDLEPIGVVVAVSAFNHPMNLIVHQLGPAVAAGCPVIVKPAGDTPLSCFRLVRLLHEAGLPQGWCQALTVTWHAVTEAMVRDPRVAFFSFIGSSRVGWMLRSKLAAGTRYALEHGGVAPVLVEPDADIADALPLLAKGAFYHAGQVCVSVQKIFVHHDIARQFADGIADIARTMKVGDPTSADTEIGPLIRPQEVERVDAWANEAREAGTEVLSGGERLVNNCYAPTVLFDPPDELSVSTAEIFGPVVCIYPYDDLDAAIARANALPFAFQAAVFCKNIDRALRAWKRLDASAVMVNDHTAFRVDWMPFAGLRESGHGVGGIPYSFHEMSVEKMLVIRSPEL
jgi:acyl-CoA reductase-like NAD-dependent aldehyde dehydrogenase